MHPRPAPRPAPRRVTPSRSNGRDASQIGVRDTSRVSHGRASGSRSPSGRDPGMMPCRVRAASAMSIDSMAAAALFGIPRSRSASGGGVRAARAFAAGPGVPPHLKGRGAGRPARPEGRRNECRNPDAPRLVPVFPGWFPPTFLAACQPMRGGPRRRAGAGGWIECRNARPRATASCRRLADSPGRLAAVPKGHGNPQVGACKAANEKAAIEACNGIPIVQFLGDHWPDFGNLGMFSISWDPNSSEPQCRHGRKT